MKTITFYSYKGGVGRSLALSNIAMRLSEYGKKVCVLDFDLEAPGLQFKFKNYKASKKINNGIVDYIHKFSNENLIPEKIIDYSLVLQPGNNFFEPIYFIPAGNIDSSEYWKKLSMINWSEMFYSEKGQGVRFFLDLKEKIKKEINPDFLLVDSRTGITDISGITLKLLADEVVVMSAYNEESIFGSKKILKSLLDTSTSLTGVAPKFNFIFSRLPFGQDEKNKEFQIIENRKEEFKKYLNLQHFEILVIHSESSLEANERQLIGDNYNEKNISISNDYLKLFDILTEDILNDREKIGFQNKKNAAIEFNKYLEEKDNARRIQYLNRAIELDSTKYEYFINRGFVSGFLGKSEEAINDFNKAINLNPNYEGSYIGLGISYYSLGEFRKAIGEFEKAIILNKNLSLAYIYKGKALREMNRTEEALKILDLALSVEPNDEMALSEKAIIYKEIGDFKNAYSSIYKAIEVNSSNPLYFGTLAEVYALEGKLEEFYLNITIALSKGLTVETMNSAKDIYTKFKNEKRFIDLMNKYDIDIKEILK